MKLTGLTDLHCHILPGIDDGCNDIEASIATAHTYVANGFSSVAATPHHIYGSGWSAPADKIQKLTDRLQLQFDQNNIPLTIYPGMEIAVSDNLWQKFDAGDYLPLAKSNTYLLEFPFQDSTRQTFTEFITDLRLRTQARFLIAHPERCQPFQKNLQRLKILCDKGCLLQLNFGSIFGWYGKTSQQAALAILENNLCHIISTDCHGKGHRGVPTTDQLNKLMNLLGENSFFDGLQRNPNKILANKDVKPLAIERNVMQQFRMNLEKRKAAQPYSKPSIFTKFKNLFT